MKQFIMAMFSFSVSLELDTLNFKGNGMFGYYDQAWVAIHREASEPQCSSLVGEFERQSGYENKCGCVAAMDGHPYATSSNFKFTLSSEEMDDALMCV